jgi:hypothetical protein
MRFHQLGCLSPTEEDERLAGYVDSWRGRPLRKDASPAYRMGYKTAAEDKGLAS